MQLSADQLEPHVGHKLTVGVIEPSNGNDDQDPIGFALECAECGETIEVVTE